METQVECLRLEGRRAVVQPEAFHLCFHGSDLLAL